MSRYIIAALFVLLASYASASPGSNAQTIPGTVSLYFPVIAKPAPTPTPPSAYLFNVAVVRSCDPQPAGNWFQGTVLIAGQPANGYLVTFSDTADGVLTGLPVLSGPHWGYPGWKPGYYSHIIGKPPRAGTWHVWIVDGSGARISEIGAWTSTGPGDGCNQAVVDFDSR